MHAGLDEHPLPIITRWALQALGQVEGPRVRRPRDPVAAWILRRYPDLAPTFTVAPVLAMIRSRTSLVDRMILDDLHRSQHRAQDVHYHRLGGGLDGRFHRLFRNHDLKLSTHREVDEPSVVEAKKSLMDESTFAASWARVRIEGSDIIRWTVPDAQGDVIVNLEGAATRLGLRLLVRVLAQIRRDCPRARVIVDFPGFLTRTGSGHLPPPTAPSRLRWEGLHETGAGKITNGHLRQMGWAVDEDIWIASRPELRAPSGVSICDGVDGIRVLRLTAC